MRLRFYTADVFTERAFGGNALAVLPWAEGLSGAQMQAIAREFNLSETAFVLPPGDARHTRRVRIYTPGAELPFAGHPTVGTAFVLAAIGEIALDGDATQVIFEEGVGPVPVSIRAREGRPVFAQLWAARLPEQGPAPPVEAIARAISLDEADLLTGGDRPEAISCGLPFLFVPVRSLDAVRRARLAHEHWQQAIAPAWAPQVFVFTHETSLPGSHVHARMFAPALGIVEDPATGAAAAALAGYLAPRDSTRQGTLRWVVEQGFEMGRPSLLEVEADKQAGEIRAVRVGGACVMMAEGSLEIPNSGET